MDDPKMWAAWIGVTATITTSFAAILAHRRELRKLRYDETRWLFELQCDLERKLMDARLQAYPEIFQGLKELSHYPPRHRSAEEWTELAGMVNGWGYGKTGMLMLPETRLEVFTLREKVLEVARGLLDPEEMMKGSRTRLADLLQRDISHTESVWSRDLPSLMSKIAKAVQEAQPKRHWINRLPFGQ